MSPRLLFLLTLSLGLAAPTTNYDLIKTIIVNYMTAFEGAQFNSTNQCFDPVTTSKLDGDIVSLMKALVFGKVEDLSALGKVFVTDLELALWMCQVEDIRTAFTYNVQVHGYGFILGNVFWRAPDIYKCVIEGSADALVFDYSGMAAQLGKANKLVSPPKPANAVVRLQYDPTYLVNFTLGLAYGLDVDQKATGPCFLAWGNVVGPICNIQSDIIALMKGDKGSMGYLVSDLLNLKQAFTQTEPTCNYTGLTQVLESLNMNTLVNNVMAHAGAIISDYQKLQGCEADVFTCGLYIGDIIRMSLGWGWYAPAPFNGQDFLSGLVHGLETSPNGSDQCIEGLNSLSTLYTALMAELKAVLAGNMSAIFQLITDYKSFSSALDANSAACNVPALLSVLKSLTTPEGLAQVSSNVKANWSAIETAGESLLSCTQDPYQCGFSAGEVVHLALGWSL